MKGLEAVEETEGEAKIGGSRESGVKGLRKEVKEVEF